MAQSIKNVGKVVPDAYHGTDYDSAEQIINKKEFYPSTGADHYFGDGVYFFESSLWHAKDWARRRAREKGITSIGIINAKIALGKCLDLFNFEYKKYVKKVAADLMSRGVDPINDSIVINFIAKTTEMDTVRGHYTVPEKGKLFEGSRLYDYDCTMICVRNHEYITEISWAFTEMII